MNWNHFFETDIWSIKNSVKKNFSVKYQQVYEKTVVYDTPRQKYKNNYFIIKKTIIIFGRKIPLALKMKSTADR